MNHSPCLEFDDKEGKERSKAEIAQLQEVAGPDIFGMVVQEGRPLLPPWQISVSRAHVLLDGTLAHLNAQLKSIPANTLSTPESILRRHLLDHGNGL
jgi:hypothetical protein